MTATLLLLTATLPAPADAPTPAEPPPAAQAATQANAQAPAQPAPTAETPPAAAAPPAPLKLPAMPNGLEGLLNESQQLLTLHLMATCHAIEILSAPDTPLPQRAADMQLLTDNMLKLRAAYRLVDPMELEIAEERVINHPTVQHIAMEFMAQVQQWAARDFDGSAELKKAVFGFLKAENRHEESEETAAEAAAAPRPAQD